MKKILLAALTLTLLFSCTKDRDFPDIPVVEELEPGDVVINEYAASGANFPDEFGETPDWIELYNTTDDTIFMEPNRWFLSDDADDPYKFSIPADTYLLPQGHFLLFADGLDTTATYVHTNFGMSAAGEALSLSALNTVNEVVSLDSRTFGPQASGKSEGRSPDGSAIWIVFNTPTPGTANP